MQVLLRWCPVPFFPDTKDRHPRPPAAVFATVPRDKRNLPAFSLNRLFSSPCFSPGGNEGHTYIEEGIPGTPWNPQADRVMELRLLYPSGHACSFSQMSN